MVYGLPANQYFRRPCPDYMTGNKATTVSSFRGRLPPKVTKLWWQTSEELLSHPVHCWATSAGTALRGVIAPILRNWRGSQTRGIFGAGRGNLENFQGWGGPGQPFFPAPGRGGACIPLTYFANLAIIQHWLDKMANNNHLQEMASSQTTQSALSNKTLIDNAEVPKKIS